MKKENRKEKRGISLIALIITIIVIVLLAAIVVNTAITTPKSANLAKFASNMGELQQAVTLTYFDIYATEAVKTNSKSAAEIYEEIAKGASASSITYNTSLPAGIDGDVAWKVNDATKLSSIETLPEGDFYITNKGVIFSAGGYENNGEIFLTASVKVGDIITSTYNEDEGVNTPALVNNLIPVYYDGGWRMADKDTSTWYDYSSKQWANAVTVKENKRGTYSVGDLIPEADIIGMFVWIPRYAYKITSGEHTNTSLGKIDVKFLKGTTDKYLVGDVETVLPEGYRVHPSFENGASTNYKNGEWNKEITGFWVAKFEASSSEATADCTFDSNGNLTTTQNSDADRKIGDKYGRISNDTDNVTVRPNVTSWRSISVNDIYEKCLEMGNYHGLSSTLKSHMMKNSEWGAVAYLTQSDYGYNAGGNNVYTNSYYEGDITEIEDIGLRTASNRGVNRYYATLTGMVGNSVNANTASWYKQIEKEYGAETVTITYQPVNAIDGTTIQYGAETEKTFYRYNDATNGVKGSTTGNIYGIYDMSGGAWEYMSSYIANGHGNITSYAPGTTSSSLLQIYATEIAAGGEGEQAGNYAAISDIYGDAVYETSSTYSTAIDSWNGDYSLFPCASGPFFIRGGSFSGGSSTGVFAFYYNYGGTNDFYGFRPVLSPM